MTSLFRRSSSNGSSRGGSSAQELNNSRPARQVRRLEFNQAMEDFKTMFPNMDYDIIECVLRANNGAVDATIDQLLQMNLDSSGCDDSSDSEDSIPAEVTPDGGSRHVAMGGGPLSGFLAATAGSWTPGHHGWLMASGQLSLILPHFCLGMVLLGCCGQIEI